LEYPFLLHELRLINSHRADQVDELRSFEECCHLRSEKHLRSHHRHPHVVSAAEFFEQIASGDLNCRFAQGIVIDGESTQTAT
jgi:hypothetical protein